MFIIFKVVVNFYCHEFVFSGATTVIHVCPGLKETSVGITIIKQNLMFLVIFLPKSMNDVSVLEINALHCHSWWSSVHDSHLPSRVEFPFSWRQQLLVDLAIFAVQAWLATDIAHIAVAGFVILVINIVIALETSISMLLALAWPLAFRLAWPGVNVLLV